MKFRGRNAHPNRVEKPPRTSGNAPGATGFFMKFRGPKALGNRRHKPIVCPTSCRQTGPSAPLFSNWLSWIGWVAANMTRSRPCAFA